MQIPLRIIGTARVAITATLLALVTGCAALSSPVERDRDEPYNVIITTREQWAEGVPLWVRLRYDGPQMKWHELQVEARPTFEGGSTATVTEHTGRVLIASTRAFEFNDWAQCVGVPPAGADKIDFRVRVFNADFLPPLITHWRSAVELPIHVSGSVDDIMEPVADSEIDRLIASDSAAYVEDIGRVRFRIDQFSPQVLNDPHLTFALTVEVLRDRKPVLSGAGWWRAGPAAPGHRHCLPALPLEGDAFDIDTLGEPGHEWQLRIRSNPEMALRDFESSRYWDGDVTIPLTLMP